MVYDAFRPYVRGQVVKRSEEAPTVLLVEGGVGLGKSKLAEEAVHVADAMEFMVVSSTAEKVETTIDVRATFDKIDTDGSGTLDREEVERAAQGSGTNSLGRSSTRRWRRWTQTATVRCRSRSSCAGGSWSRWAAGGRS